MIKILKNIPEDCEEMYMDTNALYLRFTGFLDTSNSIKYFRLPSYTSNDVESMEDIESDEDILMSDLYSQDHVEIFIFQTKKELMGWLAK